MLEEPTGKAALGYLISAAVQRLCVSNCSGLHWFVFLMSKKAGPLSGRR
jgi:hypothetical protein